MSLTGQQLLVGFSKFIGDYITSTTTSAGAGGGTTLIDTYLARFGDDRITDWYLRPTGATNQYAVRKISAFTSSTGTCTVGPAFAAQTGSAEAYELHRYDPADKFSALDEARLTLFNYLYILRYNDTLTADGISQAFDIPSAIRQGPLQVIEERPISPNPSWNFLLNPVGDSTTGWTASSATASLITQNSYDLLVPKYSNKSMHVAVATATNGTLTQTVSSMSNITAALAAGRKVSFAMWVNCRTASRVTLKILTDAGTLVTGTAHGGAGWELLTASGTVAAGNATTLSVRVDVSNASGAVEYDWNHAWFYLGDVDRVQDIYDEGHAHSVRRDDGTAKVYLSWVPERGRQLRLIGKDVLSALSGSATASMEVDEPLAQLLYAEAARILFQRRGLNTSNFPEIAARIANAEQMKRDMAKTWRMESVQPRVLRGPWG